MDKGFGDTTNFTGGGCVIPEGQFENVVVMCQGPPQRCIVSTVESDTARWPGKEAPGMRSRLPLLAGPSGLPLTPHVLHSQPPRSAPPQLLLQNFLSAPQPYSLSNGPVREQQVSDSLRVNFLGTDQQLEEIEFLTL